MEDAQKFANQANLAIEKSSWLLWRHFSTWRCLKVTKSEFKRDIDKLLKLIGGDTKFKPYFLNQ